MVSKALRWVLPLMAIALIIFVVLSGVFIFKTESEFWEAFKKTQRADRISFSSIPHNVVKTVLAAEGTDFFECDKFSYLKSLWIRTKSGVAFDSPKPDCRITHQVARDVLSQQGNLRMALWHFKGAIAVYTLHSRLSNTQIFEEFASRAYVGIGRQGLVNGAALLYGKPLNNLNLEEAAGLAAILRSPSYYSRGEHVQQFSLRRAQILEISKDGKIVFPMNGKAKLE